MKGKLVRADLKLISSFVAIVASIGGRKIEMIRTNRGGAIDTQ